MANNKEELVEWRPEWKGEDLELYKKVKQGLVESVSSVRGLRQALGLTQSDVAVILGTTQANVSKLETRPEPKLSHLSKIVQSQGGDLRVVIALPDGQTLDISRLVATG
jgi:transcriptional regulator